MNGVHPNAMLTDRQQEILDFIRTARQERGVTPTTREIQEHFGLASQTTVIDHLRALENKGVLRREPNKARGLVPTEEYRDLPMVEIPIYGTIPAGLPSDERQQADGCISVDVETLRLPKGARVFALKVRGESMTGAGIESLAASKWFGGIEELNLSGHPIGDAGAHAIAAARLPHLRHLTLMQVGLTSAGLKALVDAYSNRLQNPPDAARRSPNGSPSRRTPSPRA